MQTETSRLIFPSCSKESSMNTKYTTFPIQIGRGTFKAAQGADDPTQQTPQWVIYSGVGEGRKILLRVLQKRKTYGWNMQADKVVYVHSHQRKIMRCENE